MNKGGRVRPPPRGDEAVVRRLDRPASLAQQAYDRIRAVLLSEGGGGLQRLVERDLAEQLSMSRTPVRDALRRLELAGLAEAAPGGGYVPRRPSVRDVNEFYDLRILLEPYAAALAARRPREEVEPLLPREEEVAGRTPDGNAQFHRSVAVASGNQVLAQVIGTLNERLASQRIYAGGTDATPKALVDGHQAVIQAILEGRPEEASAVLRRHLVLARDILVRELREREAWR